MTFWDVTVKLFGGFQQTLMIFALTLLISLPLGLFISFGSMSKNPLLRYVTKTIVWMVRGVPLMLQVFIVFYVPGFMLGTPVFARFNAVIVAFAINYACYFSEIYRGGIESISLSQSEAGQVLGMTKWDIFFRVVLLQVVKRISAPMSNEVITLVKDTALSRVIMVAELIKAAEDLLNTQFLIWPLFYTGAFYLMFVGVLTLLFGYAENRLDYFKA